MQDRRREVRVPAKGAVNLVVEEPERREIRGRLIDVSAHGFRATHAHLGLAAGQEVWFRHPRADGKARVMWNRILADRVESGFMVLEAAHPRQAAR